VKVGDTVMFLIDDAWVEGVVIAPGVRDGKVSVHTVNSGPGAWVWVPLTEIDSGKVKVGRGHHVDNPAGAELAAKSTAHKLSHEQWQILDAFVDAGDNGLIDHEHQPINGLASKAARDIRERLAGWGLVEYSGNARRAVGVRKSVKVWRVTARGRAVHHERARAS
jgi:hypothetical protein